MGIKVASLYAEIGAKTDGLEQGLKRTQSGLMGARGKLTDFVSGLALVERGIAGLKAVWEFGKEGAQLEFVTGKFNRLSTSIGTTSDALLGELRTATRGTRSDMELMSSATDFMALGLAKTKDEAVRLSRVAGALGMNMNQLVLTLTNQTTMRFDALGVSVDGFKEKVDALKKTGMDANAAFSEAFLQQAEAQIKRVGDIADTSAGKIMQYEAAWANIDNTWKMRAAPAMANLADGLVRIFDLTDSPSADNAAEVINAIFKGTFLESGSSKAQNAAEDLARGINKAYYSTRDFVDVLPQAKQQTWDLREGLSDLDMAAQKTSRSTGKLAEQIARSAEIAENSKQRLRDFLGIIDADVGSPIASFIDDMKWIEAGGGRINAAFEALKKGVETGLIPPGLAEQLGSELLLGAKDLEVTLDPAKLTQASQELSDTLGIPIAEARTRILSTDGIMGALQAIQSTEWQINMRFNYSGTLPPGFTGPGSPYKPSPGIGGPGGIPGKDWDAGGAHGLNMTVPSGYPNDSFLVGVTSGERVSVTPPGKTGMTGGGGDMFVDITVIGAPGMSEAILANSVAAKLSNAQRAWSSGGAYMG